MSKPKRHTIASFQALAKSHLDKTISIDGWWGPHTENTLKELQQTVMFNGGKTVEGQLQQAIEYLQLKDLNLERVGVPKHGIEFHYAWDETNDLDQGKGHSAFYWESTVKDTIVWHHAASDTTAQRLASFFSRKDYATHFGVSRDGRIVQMAPIDHWSWHLNMGGNFVLPQNAEWRMARRTIGIELMSYGALEEKNGIFYSSTRRVVPRDEVEDLGFYFRGYRYFQKYTPQQIESCEWLMRYFYSELPAFKKRYDNYNILVDDNWFDYSFDAVNGRRPMFPHSAVRAKTDIYPSRAFMDMLLMFNSKLAIESANAFKRFG